MKRFRKRGNEESVTPLPTVRKKRWFTPPSELRRLKKQKAIRKARQAQRRRVDGDRALGCSYRKFGPGLAARRLKCAASYPGLEGEGKWRNKRKS